GQDIKDHFTAMRTAWGNTNDQGADIQDAKFGIYIIKLLPRTAKWAVLAGALMAIESSTKIMNRISTHIGFITPANPSAHAVQALGMHTSTRPAQSPSL
ncbi:hypothetical protein C0991_003691, partial [Blastosporella zonata]